MRGVAELSTGAVIAGYRIEHVAGRGGMGVVYRATQLALDRPAALKVIAPELADDVMFRERFKRESHTAASIDHPNVIPVYEAGETDGQLYIAMRYVEGTDLRDLIRREGSLSPERTVRVIEQVAAALDAAHRRGLVHRDVKPANVLLTQDGDEHVYLTDFGLTKHAASVAGMTKTGQFIGTLDYTSPEQIKGEQADARADVYALGCVLFQALAGRVPFERDSEVAKLYAHLSEEPPTLTSVAPSVPGPLDAVVEQALAKERDERYASAGEFARAARGALEATQPRAAPTIPAGPTPTAEPTAPAPATPPTPATVPSAREQPPPPAAPPPQRAPAPGRPRRPLVLALAALAAVGVLGAALAVAGVFDAGDETADPPSGGGEPGGGGEPPSQPEVAASIDVGAGPDGITVSEGTVWVSLAQNASVTPIEPRTNRPGTTVPIGANPDGLAGAGGVVWVALTDEDSARRIEGADDVPVAGANVPVGDRPEGISLGEQLVWVANSGSDTVSRVDRASATAVGAPIGVGRRPIGVFVGDESVWVTNNADGTVTRINSSTSEILDEIEVGREPRGVVEGAGSVWVANSEDGTVTRIDAQSGEVVGQPIQVGDNSRDIAFGEGFVWVTSRAANTVTRIDPDSGRVVGRPIPVGTEPLGVAVGAGAVWVANFGDNTVTRIDP
jgi:DNA-binding beta-propeller fold protein YncE/predicted Ser/Thr protein kinase